MKVHTQWGQFWHHMWWSLENFENFMKYVLSNFDDLHISPPKWPHCVGTSLCQVNFFNLIHKQAVGLFDISHPLAYTWHFLNIFITYFGHHDIFWHLSPYLKLPNTLLTCCDVKSMSKHRVTLHWTQLNCGQFQCILLVNRPLH